MFIYKIDVQTDNGTKSYIGLDTHDEHLEKRWKYHVRMASSDSPIQHIHRAMKKYGIDKCSYSVLSSNYDCIADLAVAEINYVKKYDSYRNGLNSTAGGDGIMNSDLSNIPQEQMDNIMEALSIAMSEYNTDIKWHGKSKTERQQMCSHLHTDEIYKLRSETLKNTYKNNPSLVKKRSESRKKWCQENPERAAEIARQNGLKATQKTSKKVMAIKEDGTETIYNSKQEFKRQTGLIPSTIIANTKKGKFFKGYQLKEI